MLSRKLPLKTGFLFAGLVYFQLFSQWEISPFLKNFLILIPVQVAALVYVAYFYWRGNYKQP